jgi:5-methylcytosine-specific restriction endonuclease McrA
MGRRKRFNQTAILRYLEAKCIICKEQIPDVVLTLHHKDGNAENDRWDNIVIYCRGCHDELEGRDKKKRDFR